MNTAVGIDAQSIAEVAASLEKFGARYTRRLYSENEIEYCGGSPAAARRFAGRFAAKEAVLKILNVQQLIPSWREIEVRTMIRGGSEIVLSGTAAELARERRIREISLSISDGHGMAVAVAFAYLDN